MRSSTAVSQLSDANLLAEVKVAVAGERDATVRLMALLAQLDERRLCLGEGCSSLFTYCTQILRLSEHAAYGRVEAARAARRFPVVLDLLTDGSVTLTAVTLLAPHLTTANHRDILGEARHRAPTSSRHIPAAVRREEWKRDGAQCAFVGAQVAARSATSLSQPLNRSRRSPEP